MLVRKQVIWKNDYKEKGKKAMERKKVWRPVKNMEERI